jgi:hypothetical protein
VPEPDLSYLRQVRRGVVALDEVITKIDQAAEQLAALRNASDLPAEPDRVGSMSGCTALTCPTWATDRGPVFLLTSRCFRSCPLFVWWM